MKSIHILLFSVLIVFTNKFLYSQQIDFTSPGQADTLFAGEAYNIEWDNPGNYIVNLYYTEGSSNVWDLIAENINGNSYQWQIPMLDSMNVRIRIEAINFIEPVIIWDAIPHADEIRNVDFSPDGNLFATASFDGFIRIFDTFAQIEVDFTQLVTIGRVLNAKFFRNSDTIIAANESGVYLWDRINDRTILLFAETEEVYALDIHPTKPFIATGSYDGTVRVFDVENSATVDHYIMPVTSPPTRAISVKFSPDGSELVIGESEGNVHIKQVDPPGPATSFQAHGFSGAKVIESVDISPDGNLILSSGFDRAVRIWDYQSNNIIAEFTNHSAPVWQALFSPSGIDFLTGASDNLAYQINVATLEERHSALDHESQIRAIDYSPDGDFILTAGRDDGFKLWRNYYTVEEHDTVQTYFRYKAQLQIPDFAAFMNDRVRIPLVFTHNYIGTELADVETPVEVTLAYPKRILNLLKFDGIVINDTDYDTLIYSGLSELGREDSLFLSINDALFGVIDIDTFKIVDWELPGYEIIKIEKKDGIIEIIPECGNWEELGILLSNSINQIEVFPNPVNDRTKIMLNLIEDTNYILELIDESGMILETIIEEPRKHGEYIIDFNFSELKSGVYFLNLRNGVKNYSKKIIKAD